MKLLIIFILLSCIPKKNQNNGDLVLNGIDRFNTIIKDIKSKRIGIIANHTSVTQQNIHLIKLIEENGLDLKAVFSPEHGLKGDLADGETFSSSDTIFHSLYGKNKKPQKNIMKNLDIIIFDMQSVGARFYTYISTLGYVMEACSENNVKLIVLDRMNFLGHETVSGFKLRDSLKSFVGMYPIPSIYGLTIGELALSIKKNKWLDGISNLKLDIVKIENWDGKKIIQKSSFIPTSPNIPNIETIFLYSGLCLIEGTNISEGRGTDNPFKTIGAPWLNPDKIVKDFIVEGLNIETTSFIPKTIKGKAWNPKFENQVCRGLLFKITNYDTFNSYDFALKLIHKIAITHDEFEIDRQHHFNLIFGMNTITNETIRNKDFVLDQIDKAAKEAREFRDMNKSLYLY